MAASAAQVRLLIGDTDSTDYLLSDLQIQMLIDMYGNTFVVAAAACRSLAAKFAREVDASVDSVRASNSQKYKHYSELAAAMDKQAASSGRLGVLPLAGGISIAAKATQEADTDRTTPAFTRDLFDASD